jgi:hypothetical protein
VFEPGPEAPPAEVTVRIEIRSSDFLQFRVSAPDYRFEVRMPKRMPTRVSLKDLPAPWLADRIVSLGPAFEGLQVELRSDAGVPMTATFQYPAGTVAPPPFFAQVQYPDSNVPFASTRVDNGQLQAFVRPGSPYVIWASPEGFGSVLEAFPGRSTGHAVVVPVARHARLAPSAIRLLEGPGAVQPGLRPMLLPVTVDGEGPSGGGAFYRGVVETGAISGAFTGSEIEGVDLGPRQRIGFAFTAMRDDQRADPSRSGRLLFTPRAPNTGDTVPVAVTVFDDDGGPRPPAVSVAGAALSREFFHPGWAVLAREEGGPGQGWDLRLELDAPAPPGGAAVTVSTVAQRTNVGGDGKFWEFPDCDRQCVFSSVEGPSGDYLPLVQRVVFSEGQRSATIRIEGIGDDRPEPERLFFLAFTDAEGLVPRDPTVELRIVNDDLDESLHARADRLPVPPLPRPGELDVLSNDLFPAAAFVGGQLEIIRPPTRGAASVRNQGTATVLDDRIVYAPAAGGAGTSDRLGYRLCDAWGGQCIEASVEIPIRAVPATPADAPVASDAGYRDLVFSGLPALTDARVEVLARRLGWREPVQRNGVAAPDPAQRFGRTWNDWMTFPAVSVDTPRSVLVALRGPPGSDLDLHIAYDADADFRIADSELLCSSSARGSLETCVVHFVQRAGGRDFLNLSVVNTGVTLAPFRLITSSLEGIGPLPGVSATAPTRLAEGEPFPVRVSWRTVAGARDSQPIVGVLRLRDADGGSLGDVPLVIDWDQPSFERTGATAPPSTLAPVQLASVSKEIRPARSGLPRERAFIDVPPGTGQLAVNLDYAPNADGTEVEVYLARADFGPGGSPEVAFAPPRSAAMASGTMTAMNSRLTLAVANPPAGRWYVVPSGQANGTATIDVSVQLTPARPAPTIRSGGYFNPSRSGHGLFLYPTGRDWAGLWYTYSQDGAPVWYYLQSPAPGADGVWSAPVFRSGWNGSRNHLTEVGRATITPTANDAFQFTYVLDGETGSEPFVSFGRGCPSIGGQVVDASGHWFDPARAGTGYSVQLFPNAEFYAVFAYSSRGVPRFLVAERNGVGAANDTVPLQQLRGFCPLCVRTGNPERANVGVLRREFVNGQLSRIAVDGAFTNGTPGTWAANDAVVPLGATQGCETD